MAKSKLINAAHPCPKCGYDLSGCDHANCPECGLVIDSAEFRALCKTRSRRWIIRMLVFLNYAAALYLPHGWLLFESRPWNDYHWFWLKLWPILPGLLPWLAITQLLGHRPNGGITFPIMGLVTLMLLIGSVWLGLRRVWLYWVSLTLVIIFGIWSGLVSRSLYLW